MILEQYREETFNTRYDGEVTLALYREKVTIGNMVVTKYRCFNITDYPNGSERKQLKFEAFHEEEADKLFETMKEIYARPIKKEVYQVRVIAAPAAYKFVRSKTFAVLADAEKYLEELNDIRVGAALEPIEYYTGELY
jgi:hypothetical protein